MNTQHTRRRSDNRLHKIPEVIPEVIAEIPSLLLKVDAENSTEKKSSCQKCGRQMTRGLFVHEKYCKG